MKEVIFIVYSIVYFGTSKQERYYLVTNEDHNVCFEPINYCDINNYINSGIKIDTQIVYSKPVVSIK